jgi:hypothetical protein
MFDIPSAAMFHREKYWMKEKWKKNLFIQPSNSIQSHSHTSFSLYWVRDFMWCREMQWGIIFLKILNSVAMKFHKNNLDDLLSFTYECSFKYQLNSRVAFGCFCCTLDDCRPTHIKFIHVCQRFIISLFLNINNVYKDPYIMLFCSEEIQTMQLDEHRSYYFLFKLEY